MTKQQTAHDILFQYAAKLRKRSRSDDEIRAALIDLKVTPEAAQSIIKSLDNSGIKPGGDDELTALGYISVIAAVAVSITAGVYAGQFIQENSLRFLKIVFIVLGVVLGFVVHVAITVVMEKLGVKMSRPPRSEIPTRAEIQAQLDALPNRSR